MENFAFGDRTWYACELVHHWRLLVCALLGFVYFKTRVTRNQTSKFYKVQWSNYSEREATWETEELLKSKYPELLQAYQGT